MQEQPEGNSSQIHPASRESSKNVVIYALSMAFGTMSSRVLGLVRDMAFAALFERTLTDAWTTAFRLPNMFRRLFGEGALSVSFIPVFVESCLQDVSGARSRNLVNGLYTVLLIVLLALTTLGIIFAEPTLDLLLQEGYKQIPGKFEITVRMAQIMFSFLFMISSYAYFMGILNALGKYALAAFAPVIWNVTMIITTFVPITWLASPGDAIAWGVVIGGALQTALLIPALVRAGYFPKLSSLVESFKNPDVQKVFRNMLPGMVGLGLLQITTIVNLRFASSLGEGPISYIYWADRLMELPLSLVSVSLGTALLPTLSGLWSRGDRQHMTETANYYLRLNLFVAVPAAIGLWGLSLPIVEVLFMRGKFSVTDAQSTALVVSIYSLIVFSTSCVRVLVPSFYAIKNTWLPALVSGICLVAHITIAPILMGRFGLGGLVASSFVSSSLNLILLGIGYRFIVGPFGVFRVLKSLGQFAIAGLGLALVLQLYAPLLTFLSVEPRFIHKLVALSVTIILGGLVYGGVAWVLKVEELTVSLETVISKVKGKLKGRQVKKS
jgi:putative peptidoglycan lipid II flippase